MRNIHGLNFRRQSLVAPCDASRIRDMSVEAYTSIVRLATRCRANSMAVFTSAPERSSAVTNVFRKEAYVSMGWRFFPGIVRNLGAGGG